MSGISLHRDGFGKRRSRRPGIASSRWRVQIQ
jgi:hypothetical protein